MGCEAAPFDLDLKRLLALHRQEELVVGLGLLELVDEGDATAAAAKVAKAAMSMALLEPVITAPAAAAPGAFRFPNRDATPTKPAGFA